MFVSILPVRNPSPTGAHGTKPMPSSSQVARTPFNSTLRVHSEYSVLDGGNGLHGMGAADGFRARLGEAEVQNLALLDEVFHRAGDVLDRHGRIDAVLVVEIDAVGPQALERFLDDLPDVLRSAVQARLVPSIAKPNFVAILTWSRIG